MESEENEKQYPDFESGERRYSYADCLSWPEGYCCEIIHGMAQELPPVYTAHARVCSNLLGLLSSLIEMNDCRCKIYAGIFDVRLPKNGDIAYDKIDTVVYPNDKAVTIFLLQSNG